MKKKKKEYRKAVECLKRYNYNCINIINIRENIMSINSICYDGMPHTKNLNSDVVLNKVIELQENKELNNCMKEYKAVVQALALLNEDCKYIFEKYFQKNISKWDIMNNKGMSERTFVRRKSELIYAVYMELKKLA